MEECVVIHTAELTEIGNKVIIGHLAMIHDATIHDEALIGMKSMICEYATIGEKAIVAEQSLVRKNTHIPPGKIVAGSPAKVVGNVGKRHRERVTETTIGENCQNSQRLEREPRIFKNLWESQFFMCPNSYNQFLEFKL